VIPQFERLYQRFSSEAGQASEQPA
jgi:hypothetical protein